MSSNPPQSPTSSVLSEIPQKPTKKRRASSSSLSDAEENDDDDDEEEERPLAARIATRTTGGKRSGKQHPGKKSKKSHTLQTGKGSTSNDDKTIPTTPSRNGRANGINGHEARIKVEDKLDEGQLNRLAAGVPMDAIGRSSAAVCIQIYVRYAY
jgi:histone acetyltransferase